MKDYKKTKQLRSTENNRLEKMIMTEEDYKTLFKQK